MYPIHVELYIYLCVGYRPTLKVYGHAVTQSRAIAAYATGPDVHLKYSGQTVQMHHPFPPVVQAIQEVVESALGLGGEKGGGFNHVMLNRYDDGTVYIGNHSDNKENKGSCSPLFWTSLLTFDYSGHRQCEPGRSENIYHEPEERKTWRDSEVGSWKW